MRKDRKLLNSSFNSDESNMVQYSPAVSNRALGVLHVGRTESHMRA
jgi:hypothetical protein